MLIQPNEKWGISKIMHCLKRHISRNSNIILGYAPLSSVGADGHPRLPMSDGINVDGGTNEGQMGKMMDVFTIRQRIRFVAQYGNQHPFPKFQWQKSFYDRRVRNEHELDRFWEYIRWNPEHHGLPPDWPYVFTTSFANDKWFTNLKFANLLDQYGQ
jgi:hypothetical protein